MANLEDVLAKVSEASDLLEKPGSEMGSNLEDILARVAEAADLLQQHSQDPASREIAKDYVVH